MRGGLSSATRQDKTSGGDLSGTAMGNTGV